ncbi:CDP-diacylglycerol--glycerol-3-phosphate 3-phosphatidyltransferase [Micromonospora sagamiensis]|uniref:CDP-diacylglycerol--glycerol-3-phosphate 3-phosphatidyltransferase n=1 Tax=Micromonospora sagamiensis TaxID=47875 RepID=A0A562WK19_9ACTN|nr:CDP-diacylglycerol--glycerol-3-phosphate 3-phosphatidyltransferase [Micromonospora sagamiensis]TWJ30643.1 CDP-diacylglycerol--glycerol-3-phosphate 3-phosphatidyltransferase [Micromonospora sagamiensis]BCL16325.1 CDP-diacylglycerol--glycerol-3-phosphate 3-phosphatidyltransferase [Micromonospora sagamiensis]
MTGTADSTPPAVVAPVPVLNAANALTALRLLLVPVFMVLVVASQMTHAGWRLAACLVFALASLTDFVDGWIARRFALITSVGKVADPIADKALTGTALLLLSWYAVVPWWVTVVILTRELGVTLIRFWVIRHGVIAASRGGKAKTALQILAIVWYLWPMPAAVAGAAGWIMAAAVAVTVLTGFDYVARALRLRTAR